MIKITKKINVHFLTIVMLVLCLLNRHMKVFLFSYAVMTVHEFSHMIAALGIGLKPDNITFYPYGVNLKLQNKLIHSLSDEVILYMAGPFANCIMALLSLMLYEIYRLPQIQLFYVGNIMLFMANMLPVYPLDGGVLLKKIIAYFLGNIVAERIMKCISIILITVLLLLSVYMVYITEFNFSVMLLTVFLLCSLFTQNEKYDVDFVKELMFYKRKRKNKINHIIVNEQERYADIAKKFKNNKYSVIYVENENGEIVRLMSEEEVMNKITGSI